MCRQNSRNSWLQTRSSGYSGLRHFFLFEWGEEEAQARVLAELIYRLKSDRGRRAWEYYAEFIVKKSRSRVNWSEYSAVIPVPGSKPASVHSRIFAECLAGQTGLPLRDLLYKTPGAQSQKTLSAAQRHALKSFGLKSGHTEHFTKYILVDDVLTTGESAHQCHKALGGAPGAAVLTLLFRAKQTVEY
jgi:predicted amidophosphoribosyltransferase